MRLAVLLCLATTLVLAPLGASAERIREQRPNVVFGEILGRLGSDLQMLGRDPVDQRRGFVQLVHQYNGAVGLPGRARDFAARQGL